VETVLSVSQFVAALSADNKSSSGEMVCTIPMDRERLIMQSDVSAKLFAVDVKSSRVEEIAHPFARSWRSGWLWRDGSDVDGTGVILCTSDVTVAFNTRTGAVQRLWIHPIGGMTCM
jgi:hypothetical protein